MGCMVWVQMHAVVAIGHLPLHCVDGTLVRIHLMDGKEDSIQHLVELHSLWWSGWQAFLVHVRVGVIHDEPGPLIMLRDAPKWGQMEPFQVAY